MASDTSAQPEPAASAGTAARTRVSYTREELFRGFLSVQSRGVVALPPALRRRYQLDVPGAQVEVTEREDGVLEVRPVIAVPAAEAWFWGSQWQAGEREVDKHVRAGQVSVSDSTEDFLTDLATLDEQATTETGAAPELAGGTGGRVQEDPKAVVGHVVDEG